MLEVRGLAGEAAAAPGVELAFPPPDVRRVGGAAVRLQDIDEQVFLAEDVCRASRRGRVLQAAPMRAGSIPARSTASRLAATEMVMVSSSRPGTDFSLRRRPRAMVPGSLPHCGAISSLVMRVRGMYAP